jgi:hypothetical protein
VLIGLSVAAVFTRATSHIPGDCEAGKLYCYDTPVHLGVPINTAGFEGKPSLSADGLELIRADGKEICWMGDRGDSYGDKDISCATRRALVRLD